MLEQLLDQMRGIVCGDGQDKVERFFAVDNQFHDMVSQMGKNPLADKISRVVRTLTHAVRYETVSTMINTGRGEELLEAHSDLFETLRSRRQDNVEEIVRAISKRPCMARRRTEFHKKISKGFGPLRFFSYSGRPCRISRQAALVMNTEPGRRGSRKEPSSRTATPPASWAIKDPAA